MSVPLPLEVWGVWGAAPSLRASTNHLIRACLEALAASLEREENRLCMSLAQNRGIKFARPTEECDVCEGGPIQSDYEHFEPVRSAVRENVLWSVVMLCSHGACDYG